MIHFMPIIIYFTISSTLAIYYALNAFLQYGQIAYGYPKLDLYTILLILIFGPIMLFFIVIFLICALIYDKIISFRKNIPLDLD